MSEPPSPPANEEAETNTFYGAGDGSARLMPVHPPGTMVGKYEIRRFVGHGGHGLVYEAALREADGTVKELALKQSYLSEFGVLEWEWQMLHTLTHPNLPRYYEAFRIGWFGYLAMEFVYGLDLKELLAHVGTPLGERQAIQYGIALCDAVIALHSHTPPLLHRDIKPANIRLTPGGRIKLVDFGLAKVASETTLTAQRGASLAYAPWEQLTQSAPTDVRSDVYGIGATLYHLLTNRIPTGSLTRRQDGTDTLIPPEQMNPLISKGMVAVIRRAMQRHPAARYPTVAALRADLQAIGEPSLAPEPRSHIFTGILTGVGVVVLSVVAFVGVGWGATQLLVNRNEATLPTPTPEIVVTVPAPAGVAPTATIPPSDSPSPTAESTPSSTIPPLPASPPIGYIVLRSAQGQLYEWINLRTTPSPEGAILAELRDETEPLELIATTADGEWTLIERADGVRGYVRSEFVVVEP